MKTASILYRAAMAGLGCAKPLTAVAGPPDDGVQTAHDRLVKLSQARACLSYAMRSIDLAIQDEQASRPASDNAAKAEDMIRTALREFTAP